LEGASDSEFLSRLCSFFVATKTSEDKFILWQSPIPSVRYCRPIRIQFKKEAAEATKEETLVVEERISKLKKTVITLVEQNNVVFVSHNVVLTMTDGKFVTLSLRRYMLRFDVYVMLHQSR
jgi:broad specificity phosphatase PhoE